MSRICSPSCGAGIARRRSSSIATRALSRSTAAAFITVCALNPGRSEDAVAAALRQASPTATPNARLVAIADAMLGRDGRMVDAIARIGRGRDCFEGIPFALDV